MIRYLSIALIVSAAGCGGGAKSSGGGGDDSSFKCRERRVEYTLTGGFAGTTGVSIKCTESGKATLVKWRLIEGDKEESTTHVLAGWEFDELWIKIDSTGWRHLDEECVNGAADDGDPVYQFEIADAMGSRAFMCEGTTLPFPYDRLVNELDLKAAAF